MTLKTLLKIVIGMARTYSPQILDLLEQALDRMEQTPVPAMAPPSGMKFDPSDPAAVLARQQDEIVRSLESNLAACAALKAKAP